MLLNNYIFISVHFNIFTMFNKVLNGASYTHIKADNTFANIIFKKFYSRFYLFKNLR